jgi:hypothetical protein
MLRDPREQIYTLTNPHTIGHPSEVEIQQSLGNAAHCTFFLLFPLILQALLTRLV